MSQRGNGGESEEGKDGGRATWSRESLFVLCDLCLEHVDISKGKSGSKTCQRISWKTLEVAFKTKTDLPYGKVQLKHKYDWMKNRWSLWKQLKGSETGLGWDHGKKTIGTHISIIIPEEDQMRYRGRKGIPTTNVLAACDFDLLFTYVLTGWEGSAHDARIFLDTINNPSLNFPKPPPEKYYLADKGYPDRDGYLTPYSKTRYHQSEFRGANARGRREIFNRAHSSLRSCIERAFGVLKARWKILGKMPKYSFMDQNRIICAAFALHNYIRRSTIGDPAFKIIDEDPDFIPPDVLVDVESNFTQEYIEEPRAREMSVIRDSITSSLMATRHRS